MYGALARSEQRTDNDRRSTRGTRVSAHSSDNINNSTRSCSTGTVRRKRRMYRRGTGGTLNTVLSKSRRPRYSANDGHIFTRSQLRRPSEGSKLSAPSRKSRTTRGCGSCDRPLLHKIVSSRSVHPYAGIFKRFIATVIVVDLVFFIASTEPALQDHDHLFYKVEGVTSSIFLVEYITRLAACSESRKYRNKGPFIGRLSYIVSTNALIDALATFPFFLEIMFNFDLPTFTYLRVFRLLRITKTMTFSRAMRSVNRVVYYNREILYVAMLLCVFLILFTSFIMYFLRPPDSNRSPNDSEFDSIPATMYLAALMLSGQGGPTGDLPWYTKFVVLVTSFFSVAMFAIPASMFTWGFEAEAERLAAKSFRRKRSRDDHSSSSSSSAEDGYWTDDDSIDSSDEEYERIIAGEDESSDDDNVKLASTQLKTLMTQLSERILNVDNSSRSDIKDLQRLSTILSSTRNLSYTTENERLDELQGSVERLEEKVDATTSKLDRLLEIIESKGLLMDEKE